MMTATEKILISRGIGEVCTSQDLVSVLRVSRQTLYAWACQEIHDFPATVSRGTFRRTDIANWLESKGGIYKRYLKTV